MPSAPSAIDRTPAERILIRGTNWIGDAVMTMPAVQRIREHNPFAHIAMVCPAKLHDLWRHNPFINEVIAFDGDVDTGVLRDKKFKTAIIFPNSFRSAWECWRAGIPRRVGFTGHFRRWLLTDAVSEPRDEEPVDKSVTVNGRTFTVKHFPKIRHQAHRYLDLVAHLGGNRDFIPPKMWIAADDLPSLRKFLTEGHRPFIGLNAGAEYGPAKRWPYEKFVEAAKAISAEIPCRWLIFGGPADVALAGKIESELRPHLEDDRAIINVAGKTNLTELCELLKFCRLLLTNDTGPMHLADALGTPLVAVFGSTSAPLTGPTGKHSRVINVPVECNPCFLRECPIDFRCMQAITPEMVSAAVIKLWNETEKTHGHI